MEIERIKQGTVEGGRHDSAVKYAGYLFASGLGAEKIEGLLQEWNLLNHPPLEREEISRIVLSTNGA